MKLCGISSEYEVRALTAEDVEQIYALASGNELFYRHCPPFVTRESIAADMAALPPGKSLEDKHYVGFFDGSKLIAIMDLILRYPNERTAFIGLFMMEKSAQGKGVGTRTIQEVCGFLREEGFSHLRLGYAKGNPQSEAFWKKNGFIPTGVEVDNGNYTVVVMQREI